MGVLSWLAHHLTPEQTAVTAMAVLLSVALTGHMAIYQLFGLVATTVLALVTAFQALRWVHWHGVGVGGLKWRWLRNSNALRHSLVSNPKREGTLRIVCISDTHNRHRNVRVPAGDLLIHCGDFTQHGTHGEIRDFNDWLGSLPHRHKIVIAGNHDLCLDAAEYDANWKHWRGKFHRHSEYNDPAVARSLLTNCVYVEDRSVLVEGIKIYGSPMTPPIPGRTMAFNVARGFAAQQHWAKLPSDIDILVTHGPPRGILDKTVTGQRVGEEALLKQLMSKCRPKFHVFGHIHEGYGVTRVGSTTCINCATSTLLGRPTHPPVVFDIPKRC